jgi:hypothetical protein
LSGSAAGTGSAGHDVHGDTHVVVDRADVAGEVSSVVDEGVYVAGVLVDGVKLAAIVADGLSRVVVGAAVVGWFVLVVVCCTLVVVGTAVVLAGSSVSVVVVIAAVVVGDDPVDVFEAGVTVGGGKEVAEPVTAGVADPGCGDLHL